MAWVSLNEAAAACNVSERTIRRRIEDGGLATRRHQGKVQVSIQPTDVGADQRLADTAAALAVTSEQAGRRFDRVCDNLAAAATADRQAARNARIVALVAVLGFVTVSAGAAIGYVALDQQYRDQVDSARLAETTARTNAATTQASVRASRAVSDGLQARVRGLERVNDVLVEQVDRVQVQLDLEHARVGREIVVDVVGRVRGAVGKVGAKLSQPKPVDPPAGDQLAGAPAVP